ncbi:MAG: RNA helicase [Abditibacteriota bacterium]|nr:RNA helicase [Abditibacteriota bacterium]
MIIEISWDYTEDILWIYNDEKEWLSEGFPLIDDDEVLLKLQEEIDDLYSTFYEFESHGEQVWFNKPKMKENKQKMLDLLKKLNDRINELNDGTFIVEDLETPYWENI